jgi:hypothetical protein
MLDCLIVPYALCMCAMLGDSPFPMHEIIIFNITMLHFVLFHNVTCYTISILSPHIHVNTHDFRNITYTLVATSWRGKRITLGNAFATWRRPEGRNPNARHSLTKEATHFRHRHFCTPAARLSHSLCCSFPLRTLEALKLLGFV